MRVRWPILALLIAGCQPWWPEPPKQSSSQTTTTTTEGACRDKTLFRLDPNYVAPVAGLCSCVNAGNGKSGLKYFAKGARWQDVSAALERALSDAGFSFCPASTYELAVPYSKKDSFEIQAFTVEIKQPK
jgi:hypothetical protein